MERTPDDRNVNGRPAARRTRRAAEFCFPPRTVKGFAAPCGDPSIDHLEGLVEGMISGNSPFRDIWLAGPLGAGKRTLARAIAHELGGHVTEIEPTELHCEAEACELLRGLRTGDVLVSHNIDEFRPGIRMQLVAAIAHRVAIGPSRDDSTLFLDPFPPRIARAAPATRQGLSDFFTISTTNDERCMPPAVVQRALVFNLRRSSDGAAAAVTRALRGHGITCTVDGANEFGRMLEASWGDPFAGCVALVVAQARRRGINHIDDALACELVGGCWRLVPQAGIAHTIARARARWNCSAQEAAARLRIPAALLPEPGQATIDAGFIGRPEEEDEAT